MLFDFPMQNIRKILIEFEFPPNKLPVEAIEDIPVEHRLPWVDDTQDTRNRKFSDFNSSHVIRRNYHDNDEVNSAEQKDETPGEDSESNVEDIPNRVKFSRVENVNGSVDFEWRSSNEVPEESWRTER